jgi:2-oxoglutarate dehydrogenase E1 component
MVLMQPKSMLRLPDAMSGIADLTTGTFQPVIDDPTVTGGDKKVTRLVLCTGKIYHEIRAANPGAHVAVVRVEELYPWPAHELAKVFARYPNITEVVWTQEEPKNMGAWTFAEPRLLVGIGGVKLRYAGRPERASPAEGYEATHKAEQARIIAEALNGVSATPRTNGHAAPSARSNAKAPAAVKTVRAPAAAKKNGKSPAAKKTTKAKVTKARTTAARR